MSRGAGKQFLTKGTVTFRFQHKGSASDAEAAKMKIQTAMAKEPVKFVDKTFIGVGNIEIASVEESTNGNGH